MKKYKCALPQSFCNKNIKTIVKNLIRDKISLMVIQGYKI